MDQNQLHNSESKSTTNKSRISKESLKDHELRKKGDLKEPKTKDSLCAQSKEKISETCLKRKHSISPSSQISEEKKMKCQTLGKKPDNSQFSRKGKKDGIPYHDAKVDKRLSENVKLNAVATLSGKGKAESNCYPDNCNHENRKKITAKRKYSPANSCENVTRNNPRSSFVSKQLSLKQCSSVLDSKQRYKIPKTNSQAAPKSPMNSTNEENILKDIDKKKVLGTSTKHESENTRKRGNLSCSTPSNSKGGNVSCSTPSNSKGGNVSCSTPSNSKGSNVSCSTPSNSKGGNVSCSTPSNSKGGYVSCSTPSNSKGGIVSCSKPSNSKVDRGAVALKSLEESAFNRKSIPESKLGKSRACATVSAPLSSSHSQVQGTQATKHKGNCSCPSGVSDYPPVPSTDAKFVPVPRQLIDCTSASCHKDSSWPKKSEYMSYSIESEAASRFSEDPVLTADHSTDFFSNQADSQLTFDSSNMNLNINQNANTDTGDHYDVEFMDVDEEVILTNLQEVRNQTSHIFNQNSGPCWDDIATTDAHIKDAEVNENDIKKLKSATIIVDTNVLITHLRLIKELLKTHIPEFEKPFILLPWVVMQELDYLKRRNTSTQNSNKSTSYKATDAIKFIHTHLMAKNQHLIGQTAYQANEPSDMPIESNDDRILQCCVQTKKKEGDNLVLLLTRDINLINKAVIMGISAADTQTLWSQLNLSQNSSVNKQPLPHQVTSSSSKGNTLNSTLGSQTTASTAGKNNLTESYAHNQQFTLSAAKTNRHYQPETCVQNQSPKRATVSTQNQYSRPTPASTFPNNHLQTPASGRNFHKEPFTRNQRPISTASGNFHHESFVQNQSQTLSGAKTFMQNQHLTPTENTKNISYNRQPRPSSGRIFQPESSLQDQNPTSAEKYSHNQHQRPTAAETFNHNQQIRSTSAETFNHSQHQRPTSAETFNHNQHQRPTAAETFNHNQHIRSTAAETFNHNQHQRPTAAETFNHNQHIRSTAAETFNHNQHQRLTAAETFNHNQHQRPTAAETFNHNQHQRPTSGNTNLPDTSTQSQKPRPTQDESQYRNTDSAIKISSEPQKQSTRFMPGCLPLGKIENLHELVDAKDVSDLPVDDTAVLAKFDAVWKVIFDVKQQVSSILSQGHSHTDFQAAMEMCQRIRTILSQLKEHFHSCLSMSPVIISNHVLEFEQLSSSLNSFYHDAQLACIDPSKPVSSDQLINHFKQGKNRSLLSTGFEQLVSFMEDYQILHSNYAARPSGVDWSVTG